ncbi:MAG: glucosylglycerate hydrolase, partial [Nitriliruptorales bacterium]
LREGAAAVLRANDAGGWTRPGRDLYPHRWSWDAAFIAIGLAHLDPARAAAELAGVLDRQWTSGLVPHIVYTPGVGPDVYFPDASRWGTERAAAAPIGEPRPSGICQPPVHAVAARRIWQLSRRGDDVRAAIAHLYPRLLSWHRYLAETRDPEGSGLVTIVHPWESGTDNSPRWDDALGRVTAGDDLPPYERADLRHVPDPSMRPTDADYDRYLWLVERLKRVRYDDDAVLRGHPFRVKDVLLTAVLVAANVCLLELADELEASADHKAEIRMWVERSTAALATACDPNDGLCRDRDALGGGSGHPRTVAGFAPLVAGTASPRLARRLVDVLGSADFCGHPDLRWPLPPSTSPADPAFHPRRYWRGPVWPVTVWLLWQGLERLGEHEAAGDLREAALAQAGSVGFPEYLEPFTGEPLGSRDQSWTAAVVLDWLCG